jgi:hypothetical protein
MSKQARARKGSSRASTIHSSWLAVYDGQTCVGHLLARGRFGFEGFDVDDKSLGVFRSRADAVGAVTEAAKQDDKHG